MHKFQNNKNNIICNFIRGEIITISLALILVYGKHFQSDKQLVQNGQKLTFDKCQIVYLFFDRNQQDNCQKLGVMFAMYNINVSTNI